MKKVLKYLIPAFIILVIVIFPIILPLWFFRFIGIEEYGIFNIVVGFCTPFIICISFFLTRLIIKEKKYILWHIIFYIFFLSSPLWISKTTNYIDSSYFPSLLTTGYFYVAGSLYVLRASLLGMIFYLGLNWIEKNKQTKELEKQNLQSELALLKNQLNPHFLFNTLNNIDRLIKSNPDHASQSLIELSDMMRYMLYESNVDRVPLQKELDYINDYLKLQEIQYANVNLVDYSISGSTDRIEKITVAPMLFIPFIENAFKHCTDKEKEHAIQFSMIIETEHIRFRSVNIVDLNHSINKDASSGIGLETVKRRLKILYPEKHSLQIYERNNLFCVELSIEAND